MDIYRIKLLRRIVLPLLARLNPGDVTIRHHWTGDRIRLHSYRHKGYWFHGRRRERRTLELIAQMLQPGDTVLDVGGHIGYLALYFASLVPEGRVHVFEPGPNNLPYIRHNAGLRDNLVLNDKALGAEVGRATLFVEDLTGQNNSFIQDYELFQANRDAAFSNTSVAGVDVEVTTLDAYCGAQNLSPRFVKIDVEGFELQVLTGAAGLLRDARPMLMVELSHDTGEVMSLLHAAGYLPFDDGLQPVEGREGMVTNTFWFHGEAHAELLGRLRSTPGASEG